MRPFLDTDYTSRRVNRSLGENERCSLVKSHLKMRHEKPQATGKDLRASAGIEQVKSKMPTTGLSHLRTHETPTTDDE
jgi:hypothetical protein